ncbi:MAG: hypothetical protein K0S38_860 [Candidatus Paceibacter sp.]|jgi:hypothetical protein|nr:hypothetical protein [Candidatus Paceibacter sp.]
MKKSQQGSIVLWIVVVIIALPVVAYLLGYIPGLGLFISSMTDIPIMERAIKSNNPSLCSFVRTGYDGNPHPGMCYLRLATKNLNTDSCKIAAEKVAAESGDRCFQEVVHYIDYREHDRRVEVCTMIQDEVKEKRCLEGVKKVEENPGAYGY